MTVKEGDVKVYVETLDKWDDIDISNPKVTTKNPDGETTKYGQTTAAFRYAKKMLLELSKYTSVKESKLLKETHKALLEIPDIDPDDIKDITKLPKIISILRNIGDFNEKQLNVFRFGRKWVELGQCSATDERIIKKATFAMAFLLKAIEFDLEKEIDKPLVKAKRVQLLTASQRKAHVAEVKSLIDLLEKKPITAMEKPKYHERLENFSKKSGELLSDEKELITHLKNEIDELCVDLDEKANEIILEAKEFNKEEKKSLLQIYTLKKAMAKSGVLGFWQSFKGDSDFSLFLEKFVVSEDRPSWLLAYQYQKNYQWFLDLKTKAWSSYFFWFGVEVVDAFLSLVIESANMTKNMMLAKLLAKNISVDSVNSLLFNKMQQIVQDYTELAPNESLPKDLDNYVCSYHSNRLDSLNRLKKQSIELKGQLERKEVSHYLQQAFANTSWWVWLFSPAYRRLSETISLILKNEKNPNVHQLRLVYSMMQQASDNNHLNVWAKVNINTMLLTSSKMLSTEQVLSVFNRDKSKEAVKDASSPLFWHNHLEKPTSHSLTDVLSDGEPFSQSSAVAL